MRQSTDDNQDKIREYLLGKLSAEAREEFERRLFVDDEFFQQLQTAEDDLIDDFLTGDLAKDDVAKFHQNFLVGAKRKQKLRLGKAWRGYAAAHGGQKRPKIESARGWDWRQLFSFQALKIASVAVVILVVGVVGLRVWLSPSAVDKGLLALNAAYSKERPLESRITELGYAPFSSTRGHRPANVNENELSRSELLLLEELKRKPTPDVQHALGKVYLSKREFDKASVLFESALQGDSNNAQIYTDLGAALLEKGELEGESTESGKGTESFARSLQNLNKALELDNNLLEALFNRALLHEAMGQLPQAEADWHLYLRNDASSKWADEARQRLANVKQRLSKLP